MSTKAFHWKRLRLLESPALTDAERIGRLIEALQADKPLSADQRNSAASYLRRLVLRPRAMDALTAGRGRPRDGAGYAIALAYAIQLAIQGRGKSKRARTIVATDWHKSVDTVKDSYTDHGRAARYKLRQMVEQFNGKLEGSFPQPDGSFSEHYWTEAEIHAAMYADLCDWHRDNRR